MKQGLGQARPNKKQHGQGTTMCLIWQDENSPYQVLSPCGVCQERLRYWGEDVQVAVTTDEEKLRFVELRGLQPYHWTKAYPIEEMDFWKE